MKQHFWLNLRRVLRSGFVSFWRAPVLALGSIITLTVTLLIIGLLFLGGVFLLSSLQTISNRVDVSVAFKPDAAETEVLKVKKDLELLPEVASVDYFSAQQEYDAFKLSHSDNDLVIRSLEEVGNPFGARLNIRATDPSHYAAIAEFLKGGDALDATGGSLIEQVSFKKDIIDKFVSLVALSKQIGLALVIVFAFISILSTFTAISLAIYSSREEISLMKLVGAGNSYVGGPFIIQGVMAGLIAALLALALLYPMIWWLRSGTSSLFGGLNLVDYFYNYLLGLAGLVVGSGVFLGAVASFLAVRRYLNV
jgi:cell division transport system permease protein